jgi:hypothetical protein
MQIILEIFLDLLNLIVGIEAYNNTSVLVSILIYLSRNFVLK